MDCDDALVLLAAREVRTLDHREEARFASHVEGCESCREAKRAGETEAEEAWWIMRAAGADEEPIIPTVNPSVFEIGEEVAAGGMGRVLRARDRRLGRMVAIKESLEHGMHARFEREALITARLQHPAIVPIYEAGMWPDGTRFYTMRLVPGRTLAAAIAEAEPGKRLALLRHVIAAVEAVAHAHDNQIIHRDLKPGNILVGDLGETVVIDWGIARRLDQDDEEAPVDSEPSSIAIDRKLTRIGAVLGTPGYMAPEQARGETLDERTDVFSLGAVLFTLLAGDAPWALLHDDQTALLARTGREPPPSIDFAAPDAPKDLRAIVSKAMAFAPADRYRTAREMAADLERFETGQLIARPYKTSELLARWVRRHKAAVTIAVLAALALALVSAVLIHGLAEARDVAEDRQRDAEEARAIADRERQASEQSLARSLEDQGRQAYLAGASDRALVLVSEALTRGRDTASLRHLLGATTREGALISQRISAGKGEWRSLAITPSELILLDNTKVRIWAKGEKQKFKPVRDVLDQLVLADGLDAVIASEHEIARYSLSLRSARWTARLDPAPHARLVSAGGRIAIATTTELAVLALASGELLGKLPIASEHYALSPDGRYLAAADGRGNVSLWGDKLATLATWKTDAAVEHLVVRDGEGVVVGNRHGVTAWTKQGSKVLALDFETRALVASDRTRTIVAGDNRGRIFVWDYEGVERGAHYALDTIKALALSPDGQLLAASDTTRTVIFDVHTLAAIAELATPDAEVLEWRADGQELAVLGHELVRVRRPTGIVRQRLPTTHAVRAGTSWIATGSTTIVRALDGAELARFGGLAVRADGTASSDGRTLVIRGSATDPRASQLLSLPDGKPLASFKAVQVRMTGQGVAALDEDDAEIRLTILDDRGATRTTKTFPRGALRGIEPGPDPRSLFVLHGDRVELVELDTLAVRTRLDGLPPRLVETSRRGAHLAIVGNGDSQVVMLRELASGRVLERRTIGGSVDGVWISDDGQTYAVLVDRNRVEVRVVGRETPLLERPGITSAALAPDGTRLATGNNHGVLEIWDLESGLLVESQRYHREQISRIEWIDADRFLVQSNDATATLWAVPRSRASVDEVRALAKATSWRYQDGRLIHK